MIFRVEILFLITLLSCAQTFAQSEQVYEADVCIYGGTAAGVIAAYTVQKLGKTAILIEPGSYLGGMTSGGLGHTDLENKSVVTGLARDFYRRVGKHYNTFEKWTFEPHVAERIFSDYASEGGFKIFYQTKLSDVRKVQNSVVYITVQNPIDSVSKEIQVRARIFIDCSYEGDLMAKAGVPYRVGREANSEYSETYNGVQIMDSNQFPDKIDPYKIKGKPASGLLWGVSDADLQKNGSGDSKIQAYGYRICLTSEPANRIAISRPPDYDSSRYELMLRLIDAQPDRRRLTDYFVINKLPNSKTDIESHGGFSTDMVGMNHRYPEGSYEERRHIVRAHETYSKGLLYFLGHDWRVPEPLRKEMLQYGYPADEFLANNHWSYQLYIRESRRMVGDYVMTQANCEGKRNAPDEIALVANKMNSHSCQRIIANGNVKNEGNVSIGGFNPYGIAYGAITPKEEDCMNLFVPVCLSSTHIARSSIQTEPVLMVLGQSAATAAVMAIDVQIPVQKINVRRLQQYLKNNPLADNSIADVLIDNDNHRHTRKTGKDWELVHGGGYGASFLIAEPPDEKSLLKRRSRISSIRYNAAIEVPGKYDVYMYLPKVEGCSEFMTIRVSDGTEVRERVITPANLVIDGSKKGDWISLGRHQISGGKRPFVEISNETAKGKIIADAVIWVPVRNR